MLNLLPHQVAAREDILNSLKSHERTTLVSACGTGKTITLQSVAAEHDLVVAFFPSLALVDQTLQSWRRQYDGQWEPPIVVCSDDTVGRRSEDEIVVSDDDLRHHGALVERDPRALAARLAKPRTRPQVVFSTYQSSAKIADAQQVHGAPTFDILVADEAHKLATKNAADRTDASGRLVLDSEAIRARRRVFATATPHIIDLNKHLDREVISMDDEELFGPVAHEFGLRDAIERGLLSNYKILILATQAGDTPASDTPEVRMEMGAAALEQMKERGVRSVIAYLSSRSRANEFANRVGQIMPADVITGDQPTAVRAPKIERLATAGGVITNVRCLTEGVDVPSLDAVLFVDPRNSKIDITQAVGRAIRVAPGKELGYVVIPVFAEPGDDAYANDSFKRLWDVLLQLAENDTALNTMLNDVRERQSTGEVIDLDGFADGPGIEVIGDLEVRDIILRASRIGDPLGADWRGRLQEVIRFRKANGALPRINGVNLSADELKLGTWLGEQRRTLKAGVLSHDRRARLDELVPGWADTHNDVWGSKASEVAAWIAANGRVPRVSGLNVSAEEKKLGVWVKNQRAKLKAGKLRPDRRMRLDELVPGWDTTFDDAWDLRAAEIAVWIESNGDTPRMKGPNIGPEEQIFGTWLGEQRRNLKAGMLSAQRRSRLDELVPGWDATSDDAWGSRATEFGTWVSANGRAPRTAGANRSVEEQRHGKWLSNQRSSLKAGKLTSDRNARLSEMLPGWESGAGRKKLASRTLAS